MANRIEDYGLIGNMISAALVGRDGSIDWLCLPRFDSQACFSAILGNPDDGRWQIRPKTADVKVSHRYLPDTAVLETRFETDSGVVTLTDFMPLSDDEERADIVRIVNGVEGEVEMEMELVVRFGYGETVPWVRRRDYGLSAIAGPDAIELHTRLPLRGENMRTVSSFTVCAGDRVPMAMSYHRSHCQPHFVPDRAESFDRTTIWWREWVKRGTMDTLPECWRDAVVRSLITLKMLTFKPTGAIVAAPTTSLPELIGGSRNWDYRYCWLRDSALTLYALINSGYREEADAWRQWLVRAIAGHPQQLRIMYGIAGERWLPEAVIPWLDGYMNSCPVRIGNDAAGQTQLDIYGELVDMLHVARSAELQPEREAWRLQRVLLEHLETVWNTLDHGIWEMRGEPKAFTHSRMMCWAAFDRSIASAEQFGLDGPVERWRELRDTIHADICDNGFDSGKNCFVQYYGGKSLDASILLMPQLGFLPSDDPRIVGTIEAVERELLVGGFVQRYSTDNTDDGVGGKEGAFLACSFWLVDAYILIGRRDDAVELFERLVGLTNDLGLLAEEYDTGSGQLVGNFPQAFSHIGLINSAHNLAHADGPARQRAS